MSESKTVYEFFPKFGKIRDEVLFGDVWEQPELSKRDRSLVTVAVLTALYRTDELKVHLKRAVDNGVTQDEIAGLITHLAFYAGLADSGELRAACESYVRRAGLRVQ